MHDKTRTGRGISGLSAGTCGDAGLVPGTVVGLSRRDVGVVRLYARAIIDRPWVCAGVSWARFGYSRAGSCRVVAAGTVLTLVLDYINLRVKGVVSHPITFTVIVLRRGPSNSPNCTAINR